MKTSMVGTIRAALAASIAPEKLRFRFLFRGTEEMEYNPIYNDWIGRKNGPNKRIFSFEKSNLKAMNVIQEQLTDQELQRLTNSLRQRLGRHGLRLTKVIWLSQYKMLTIETEEKCEI